MTNRLKQIYDRGKDYIDYQLGTAGAVVMGGIVGLVNSSEGALGATTAALKQGAYTFLIGGTVCKATERIAQSRIKNNLLAITLAATIPATATIAATYGVHKLKGTPKPLRSTVPTMIIAPLGLAGLAIIKRRRYQKENQNE